MPVARNRRFLHILVCMKRNVSEVSVAIPKERIIYVNFITYFRKTSVFLCGCFLNSINFETLITYFVLLSYGQKGSVVFVLTILFISNRVPTSTAKPEKMREVFPVREKSGNFKTLPESQGIFCQGGKSRGIFQLYQKVSEKSGNFLSGREN